MTKKSNQEQISDEELIRKYFEAIRKQLEVLVERYRHDILDAYKILVPTNQDQEKSNFYENQRIEFEKLFRGDFLQISRTEFTWENYLNYVNKYPNAIQEMRNAINVESETGDQNFGFKKLVTIQSNIFSYAEIMKYVHQLAFEKNEKSDWEEGPKHSLTIRYNKIKRKKNDDLTDLTPTQTIAFFEILIKNNAILPIYNGRNSPDKSRPISNFAAAISLLTGFSKDSVEQKISKCTKEDYERAWQKIREIAKNYTLPPKQS